MEDKNLKEITKELQCLSPEEVATLFDIHKERVYILARRGIIPAFKLNNGVWRIPLYKLRDFIEERLNQSMAGKTEKKTEIKGLRWNAQTKRYEMQK
jgi:hypothetical protein